MDAPERAVKIACSRIGRRGLRGYLLTLPRVWVRDLGLSVGDYVDVYRDPDDRLVLTRSEAQTDE